MKRDMELIRLSLLEVEREEPAPDLSGYSTRLARGRTVNMPKHGPTSNMQEI